MANNKDRYKAEKEKLRNEFGQLFETISQILFHHDPIRINYDFNTDEYEPEAQAILPQLKEYHSISHVQKLVHDVFVKLFSPEDAGAESKYKVIAEEIWEAWRDYKFPWIKADITFTPTSEGGRTHPLDLRGEAFYRPHIVVGDMAQRKTIVREGNMIDEEYLGVQFRPTPFIITPGESTTLKLELIYQPSVNYEKLIPNAEFTIREGPKIVGYGKILEVSHFE